MRVCVRVSSCAADNTFVDCMNYTLPPAQRTNCSKTWHHSWVHDCREKGVRGDDFNLNLTMHHLVVYNLGEGRNGYDRNDAPVPYYLRYINDGDRVS